MSVAQPRVHLGRQPIYTGEGWLYGYELLFRPFAGASASAVPAPRGGSAGAPPGEPTPEDEAGDLATTATILSAFTDFDLDDLLGGRVGFLNLTRAFVTGRLPLPVAPGRVTLEILEHLTVDDALREGTAELAAQGHRLALDDFVLGGPTTELLDLAHFIKVDVLTTRWEDVVRTVAAGRERGIVLIAEKVEDDDMARRCVDHGFDLVQGYHTGRPETLSVTSVGPSTTNALVLLATLSRDDVSIAEVVDVLRRDAGLTFRLLKLANSAAAGQHRQVSGLRDVVMTVGLDQLRSWVTLLALRGVLSDPSDLNRVITRARACEDVAARLSPQVAPDLAFTAGLLSGLAQVMSWPAHELTSQLVQLHPTVTLALTGAGPLRTVMTAVEAYERGDAQTLVALQADLDALTAAWLDAIRWANRTEATVQTTTVD